jgi:thiol-disulfide isomerase/thioredoxin
VTRRARIALAVAALAALQVTAVVVYRAVESARSDDPSARRFATEVLSATEPAPPFEAVRADGATLSVTWPTARVRIVHFWATWCEPCRDELPGLLAATGALRAEGVELVAVAVDDDWSEIRAFFGGAPPPEIVSARPGDAHKRYGVSTLPDTYVVNRAGHLVERIDGARDWRTPAARAHLQRLIE